MLHFVNILQSRLERVAEATIGEYHVGVCTETSTTEQIFTVKQIWKNTGRETLMYARHLFTFVKHMLRQVGPDLPVFYMNLSPI